MPKTAWEVFVRASIALGWGLLLVGGALIATPLPPAAPPSQTTDAPLDRSPVDLQLTRDDCHVFTANQSAGTVSVLRCRDGQVLSEVPCGARPAALALSPDETELYATASFAGEVVSYRWQEGRLSERRRLYLGFEPRGLAISPSGQWLYVALHTAHAVAVIDVKEWREVARITTGRWPRALALNADGSRLVVACCGDGGLAVIDTARGQQLFLEDFAGLNLGQVQVDREGRYAYSPYMNYRGFPITPNNIRQGWVLASRLVRVKLAARARREALALDPPGRAVSDPHGLALSPDETTLVATAGGTQELLVFRLSDLPFQDYGGPKDHIEPALLADRQRFRRIHLGGRPLNVRYARDGRRVFVANYLLNAVQVVDVPAGTVVATWSLGGPAEPSLARLGEAIFYDGRRSLDQWYSCHSCHQDGHTNAAVMDTRNDGRHGNYKVVLSLRNVTRTGPWTWHGWQTDFDLALRKSLTDSMLGPEPSTQDVRALSAFLESLQPPPNPHRQRDGSLSAAAERGRQVFRSAKAACHTCHGGDYATDGKTHDVGTGSKTDVYPGYNPPSLIGCYDRLHYLHDGRATTLEEVLTKYHDPAQVTGLGELTAAERADLLAYLRSL